MRTLVLLTLTLLLLAGCRIPPDVSNREMQFSLSFAPDPPSLGEAVAVVTVTRDRVAQPDIPITLSGVAKTDGILAVEGEGRTDAAGHLLVPFNWSHSGDWVITVTATLANGATVEREFHYYLPEPAPP